MITAIFLATAIAVALLLCGAVSERSDNPDTRSGAFIPYFLGAAVGVIAMILIAVHLLT